MLLIRFFIDMTAYWYCTNYSQLKSSKTFFMWIIAWTFDPLPGMTNLSAVSTLGLGQSLWLSPHNRLLVFHLVHWTGWWILAGWWVMAGWWILARGRASGGRFAGPRGWVWRWWSPKLSISIFITFSLYFCEEWNIGDKKKVWIHLEYKMYIYRNYASFLSNSCGSIIILIKIL